MEGSDSLTATLCSWAASSYLTEFFTEANSNLSFYQDNPKIITVLDLAEFPAFEGVILQYMYCIVEGPTTFTVPATLQGRTSVS